MQLTGIAHAPYADRRFAAMRVVFGLVDVSAAGDADLSASEENAVARPAQIINGVEGMKARYGTLERNQFRLDGTFQLFPDNPSAQQVGWWSAAQSDENGNLADPPTLTFHFTQPHSSMGFTVIFDDKADEYCTEFTIQTYDADGTLLTMAEVTGNTLADCPTELFTDNYRKVVFTFHKTDKPYRYVRVAQVLFGILQKKNNSNIEQCELLYAVSPTMETAPANEFTITFQNTDRRYNMVNPQGIYRFLQQGQRLDVELATSTAPNVRELINMGKFYFSSSKASDSSMTAKITAHSPFYAMERTKYRMGRTGTTSVKAFVAEIFADAGFPLVVRDVDSVGERIICTACEAVSHREAVRLAAQAARCMCLLTREDEVLLVDPAIGTPTDTLTMDNQNDMPEIDRPDRINVVEVSVRRLSSGTGGTTELHSSTVNIQGTQTRWFDYQSAASGASASVTGGTLVSAQYFLSAAWLTITASGDVTVRITGTTYESKDTLARAQRLESNDREQVEEFRNPLIAQGGEQQVADWLLNLRYTRFTYRVTDRGNPAREIGDSVQIYDAYDEHRAALVTKLRLKWDGTLSATMEAEGGNG